MADHQAMLARIEQLVAALTVTDNVQRRQAEEAYTQLKSDPENLILALLHCSRRAAETTVRL